MKNNPLRTRCPKCQRTTQLQEDWKSGDTVICGHCENVFIAMKAWAVKGLPKPLQRHAERTNPTLPSQKTKQTQL